MKVYNNIIANRKTMSIDIIYVFLTDTSNETNINYFIAISNEITGGYEQGVIGKLLVISIVFIF